jgi:hypothetical protein
MEKMIKRQIVIIIWLLAAALCLIFALFGEPRAAVIF